MHKTKIVTLLALFSPLSNASVHSIECTFDSINQHEILITKSTKFRNMSLTRIYTIDKGVPLDIFDSLYHDEDNSTAIGYTIINDVGGSLVQSIVLEDGYQLENGSVGRKFVLSPIEMTDGPIVDQITVSTCAF